MEAMEDIFLDIKSAVKNLAELSLDFIHSNELIMTSGYSKSVYQFLKVCY